MFRFTEETEKKKLQGVEGFVSFVNLFRIEKLKSNNSGSWHNVFFFSFSPHSLFLEMEFPYVV